MKNRLFVTEVKKHFKWWFWRWKTS